MNKFQDFDRMLLRMMRDFGGAATLRIFAEPIEVDGEVIPSKQDLPVTAILLDYPAMGAGSKQNFNTLILEGDKQCFVLPRNKSYTGASQPTVQPNRDRMIIDGVEWKIMNQKETNSSMTDNLLFEFHLRK